MTRKPPSKLSRRTDTREAVRHLARAIRGLTHEISVLRRYVLELRAQHAPREYEVPPNPSAWTMDGQGNWYFNGIKAKEVFRSPNAPNDWPRL